RVVLDAKIASNTRFDRVNFTHLGFQAWRLGSSRIHMRGDRHIVLVPLDVCGAAQCEIKPFRVILENIGDSLIKVSVRMRGGMERCKILLLQEGYQAKEPKIIDDFVKYRDIWYATTIINSLQSIRIEEES